MTTEAQNLKPENITLKVEPAQLDKLYDLMRRTNKPQSLDVLTRRYIELLKEAAGIKKA